MKLFSEREGFEAPKVLQLEGMDEDLRNSIWNILFKYIFVALHGNTYDFSKKYYKDLVASIWKSFFKLRVDEISCYSHEVIEHFKLFIAEAEWYKVYSLLEFIVPRTAQRSSIIREFNSVFEIENSGYRFVNDSIAPITNQSEIYEIEEASIIQLENVHTHIRRAVSLISEKDNPNYSNAVKESVNAVEALCKVIVGKDSITLGAAISAIEKQGKIDINTSLKKVITHIWGYSSNFEGIRHSLKPGEKSNITFEESKFFLVTCSALVNYLSAKANKAGMVLQ